jgi:hypothetical protein
MPSAPPPNMQRVRLPTAGLAELEKNALVAWHPKVSLGLPLLVVLFFHGLEPDPNNPDSQRAQNFAWTGHGLPDQLATCGKNAVLIAPTMRFKHGDQSDYVDSGYLATRDQIATLVQDGLSAIGRSLGRADGWPAESVIRQAKLLLAGFSNGYLAWNAAVGALRSPTGSLVEPPTVIGHSLFDCLYWSALLMEGVVENSPVANARFSPRSRAILNSAFVTTHFTPTNPTYKAQAQYLQAMIAREPALASHNQIPGSLGPNEIVMAVLPASTGHLQAVRQDNGLSHVMAAVAGLDLPEIPSA